MGKDSRWGGRTGTRSRRNASISERKTHKTLYSNVCAQQTHQSVLLCSCDVELHSKIANAISMMATDTFSSIEQSRKEAGTMYLTRGREAVEQGFWQ